MSEHKAIPICVLTFTPPAERIKLVEGEIKKFKEQNPRARIETEVASDGSGVHVTISYYPDALASGTLHSTVAKAVGEFAERGAIASLDSKAKA